MVVNASTHAKLYSVIRKYMLLNTILTTLFIP